MAVHNASAPFALVALALVLGHCGSGGISTRRPCEDSGDCFSDESCLAGGCVFDGSIKEGETCTRHRQCEKDLACRSFICQPGCRHPYAIGACEENYWCSPDASGTAGDCKPSQCDPSSVVHCINNERCVAMGAHVGSCMAICQYGFVGGTYNDTCSTTEESCKPVGINNSSVCLPTDSEAALKVGDAGCDLSSNPCERGAVCVNIVCRKLCSNSVEGTCDPGEICEPLEPARQLYYCRAP